MKKKAFLLYFLLPILTSSEEICSFPPQILGGQFKVLSLVPKKSVKYSCQKGYFLWGQEILQCDPVLGWPNIKAQCLVDSAQNKVAFSSNSDHEKAARPILGSRKNGCFRAESEQSAWWSVDLMEKHDIKAINITLGGNFELPRR